MTGLEYISGTSPENENRPGPGEDREDVSKVVETITRLNIARYNVGAYPEGHQLIRQSLDSALRSLRACVHTPSGLALGAAGDVLLYRAETLAPGNSACRDLAAALYQRNIAAISFLPGIGREELLRFIKLISIKPQEITSQGGLQKILKKNAFRNITVRPADYGTLRFTEQKEAVRPSGIKQTGSDEVLHSFTGNLMAEMSAASPEQRNVLGREELQRPRMLASLINADRTGAGEFLQSYQKTLGSYFDKKKAARTTDNGESGRLRGINNFLQALDPENRRHFLAVTLQLCSSVPISSGVDSFFEELDRELAMEMLLQANEQGVEISPSLMNFLQKFMHSFTGDTADFDQEQETEERTRPEARIRKLFKREEFEQYVVEDYARVLMKLADTPLLEDGVPREEFPLEEYLQTLDGQYLYNRIARVLLIFMNNEESPQEYRQTFDLLISIAETCLEQGDFLLLSNILQTVNLHRERKSDPELRVVATECFQNFQKAPFLTRALVAFDAQLGHLTRAPIMFLYLLGDVVVPGLLDLYLDKENDKERRILLHVLESFRDAAVVEARNRLEYAEPEQAGPLLRVLSSYGNRDTVQFLKEFLDHRDRMVRKEVFAALLTLRDQWALDSLGEFLRSDDWSIKSGAVEYVGRCGLHEFVPDLVAMLEDKGFFQKDFQELETVIMALGRIGDPATVPALENIVQRRFGLYPEKLNRLKQTIFDSLERYPGVSLAGLLEIGRKSKKKSIRLASQRVILKGMARAIQGVGRESSDDSRSG
ncbi:MAG: HEAT repeat domain-containing protein [Desulfobacterales bacterium]|nr:HEAT repeat domain-containing protein [Desulfobacterales bacterium]